MSNPTQQCSRVGNSRDPQPSFARSGGGAGSAAVSLSKHPCAPRQSAVLGPAVTIAGLLITQTESLHMSNAIAAHKHRTMLHVLRDRVQRAQRDEKRGMPGAAERVAAHTAKRAAYRAANP